MKYAHAAALLSVVLFTLACKNFTSSKVKDDQTTNVDVNLIAKPEAFIPPEFRDFHFVHEEAQASGSVKVFLRLASAKIVKEGVCYVAEFLAMGSGSKSEGQRVTRNVSASGGGVVEVEGILAIDICFSTTNEAAPLSFQGSHWLRGPTITKMHSWGGSTNRAARWRPLPRLIARIAGNVARQQAAAQTGANAHQALIAMQTELPREISTILRTQIAEFQPEAREFVANLKEYLGGNFKIYQDASLKLLVLRVEGSRPESKPPRINAEAMDKHVVLQVSEEWLQKKFRQINPLKTGQQYSLAELVSIQSEVSALLPGEAPTSNAPIEIPALATYLYVEFPELKEDETFKLSIAKNTCQMAFPARIHVDLQAMARDFFGFQGESPRTPVLMMQVHLCLHKESGTSLRTEVKVEAIDEKSFYDGLLQEFPTASVVMLQLVRQTVRDTIARQVQAKLEELVPRYFDLPTFQQDQIRLAASQLIFTDQFVTMVYEEGPPTIGITYRREVSSAGEFFRVLSVARGSKAEKAGLRTNDFIEAFGGRKAKEISDLPAFIVSSHRSEAKLLHVDFQRYDKTSKKHQILSAELPLH